MLLDSVGPFQSNPTSGAGALPMNGSIGLGYNTMAPPKSMPLDELANQLTDANNRVNQMAKAVRMLADKLFGEQPESAGIGQPMTPRSGTVGSLNCQADYTLASIAELERQINRLTPLV